VSTSDAATFIYPGRRHAIVFMTVLNDTPSAITHSSPFDVHDDSYDRQCALFFLVISLLASLAPLHPTSTRYYRVMQMYQLYIAGVTSIARGDVTGNKNDDDNIL